MPATSNRVTGAHRPDADSDLAFAGLARLAELLAQGQLTPRELTELYLRRIERFDQQLNAFVSVRSDAALAEADAALARFSCGLDQARPAQPSTPSTRSSTSRSAPSSC